MTSKDIDEANNSCTTSIDTIETVNTSSTDQDAKNDFKSDISENDDDIKIVFKPWTFLDSFPENMGTIVNLQIITF